MVKLDIAITGRGVVSAVGCSVDIVSQRLVTGWRPQESRELRSGGDSWDVPPYYALPDGCLERPRGLRTTDPFTMATVSAADQALAEAGIEDCSDVGLVFSTIVGPVQAGQEYVERVLVRGPVGVSPTLFLDSIINMAAAHLSMIRGVRGATAVLSGTHPLEVARLWLSCGHEHTVLLVATEYFSPGSLEGMVAFQVETAPGERWPRLGQASAAVVVETTFHAAERGAVPIALIEGLAGVASESAETEYWKLQVDVARRAICEALAGASVEGREIQYVYSCGNRVPELEDAERDALSVVLVPGAKTVRPKYVFGETVGASGMVGLLAATLATSEEEAGAARLSLVNDLEVTGQFWSAIVRVPESRR